MSEKPAWMRLYEEYDPEPTHYTILTTDRNVFEKLGDRYLTLESAQHACRQHWHEILGMNDGRLAFSVGRKTHVMLPASDVETNLRRYYISAEYNE
jgi:hypothetical protein